MNLLITTLGTSWQIVPELFALTNPDNYDFFSGNKNAAEFRTKNKIQKIDSLWVITTEGQRNLPSLQNWAEKWKCNLHLFVCKGVNDLQSEAEILKMRSFIYRVVLYGSEISDVLYLSLAGGRKTMSADMQEAANLFGCDAMIHIVDVAKIPDDYKKDSLLENPNSEYVNCFLPILVSGKAEPNLLVSADNEPIKSKNFPLCFDEKTAIQILEEDGMLEKEIENRKKRSSQVYTNFYSRISTENSSRRDLFKKLYFLHPQKLQKLREYRLGIDRKKDLEIFRKLPKAELHSHLGGVLSPSEIIEVAKEERDYRVKPDNDTLCKPDNDINAESENAPSCKVRDDARIKFKENITKILSYENGPESFEKLIYGNYLDEKDFYNIGIVAYQKLGDFQGSALLQTEKTIAKTLEIYAENLIRENVKYVEIRCSPYKYTKLGLSINQVVDRMTKTLEKYSDRLEYRFIYIIGRQATKAEIKKSVDEILGLLERNSDFRSKLVGIDLAGNEGATKPSELRDEFMPLLEKCLNITIHAGETESAESIWEAVYHLSADRIGHGLRLLEKPELLERFLSKNIGVEMCPSSNFQIVGFYQKDLNQSGKKYPLAEYIRRGLKVSLNTDDQGISRTNLANEFLKASELCPELTLWDFIVLIRNSVSMAFCDSKTKTRLMHSFEDEILALLQEIL